MSNDEKFTMKDGIIAELAHQWNVENGKGVHTIEELRSNIEATILQVAEETFALDQDIVLEDVYVKEIPENFYVKAFNELEFSILNINEIAEEVVKKYPQFETSKVYAVLHRLISTSDQLLIKPSPGNFEINFDRLKFPGAKKSLNKSIELKKFIDSLQDTQNELENLLQLLESNATEFMLSDVDKTMLTTELELITQAVNSIKIYRIN